MNWAKRIAAPVVALLLMLTLMVCANAATDAVSCDEASYATLAKAVEAAQPGSVLRLNQDITETLTIGKDLTLDLNGFRVSGTVTVAEGTILFVKDSTTDDFTADSYGYIKTVGDAQPAEGYIAITEAEGTSYHRLDLQITSINLRPGNVGIYYGSSFGGDEAVKAKIAYYGTALSITGAPTTQEIVADKHYSRHTAFSGDSWVCGEAGKAYGTLLKGIWKDTNYQQNNAENAERKIYSVSYVQLTDGTIILGKSVSMSLRDVTEKIDTNWNTLDALQVSAMKEMYEADDTILEKWKVPNLKKNVAYPVTFVDYDDAVIDIQQIAYGGFATAPQDNPTRDGYVFSGWDIDVRNVEVQGKLKVRATYKALYTVTFVDYDGSVLKEEVVSSGDDATAYAFKASEKPPEGYNRIGWDKSFDNITEDTTVTATYEAKKYTVEFYMPDGSLIEKKENVEYGSIVEEPVYAEHYFDWDNHRMGVFSGWNKDLKEKITADTTIYAQYENDFDQPVISIDTTSKRASIELYVPGGCYLYAIDLGFNWTGSIAITNCTKNTASPLYKGNYARGSFDYNNKSNRFYYAWVDGAGVAVPPSGGKTYSYAEILDITFDISGGFTVNKDALKLFEDCKISVAAKTGAKIDEIQTITPIVVVK